MLSSIYSAFSGMFGFSKGLDVISNNVANMNTPGFKSSELRFYDLFYRYGLGQGIGGAGEQIGQGVNTGATRMNFKQGDLRETTNNLDLAINGNGFFILTKDGETYYTRNGQFQFNNEGILVEQSTQAHVAAYNGATLGDISLVGMRVNPQRATSEVTFLDRLNVGQTTTPYEVTNVTAIDSAGGSHTLTLRFLQTNSATLNSSALTTTDPNVTSLSRNSTALTTSRNRARIDSALTTVTTAQTTYTVQPSDTDWDAIATAIYGDPSAAEALRDQLGNPSLPTAGTTLSGIPASLTFYTVQAGDDWASVAAILYGNADAATVLQNALVGQTLTADNGLFDLPATLTVPAATPFYTVQSGDTWGSIAQQFYGQTANNGSSAAGRDLAIALGEDPDAPPSGELSGFPTTLSLAAPIQITGVAPYYTVGADDTWDSIARALYGSPMGTKLQSQMTGQTLTPGNRLGNFPTTLTLSTANGTVHRYTVEVLEGTNSLARGEIRYGGSGTPLAGYETMTFNLAPTGIASSAITLNFRETGTMSGTSTMRVNTQNGYTVGSLVDQTFDENGVLTLTYSNGQTERRGQLALAWFEDIQTLTQTGNGMFAPANGQTARISTAGTQGFGSVVGKRIELSNVDLTSQFTDMVVIQRGYQASSQIISVANEMTQQLLDLRSRR